MLIKTAIIIFGFTCIGSQIVLIRELLTVFYGNEFSIGFILGFWLLGGTIGSLRGALVDKIKNRVYLFSALQLLLSILLPLSIFLAKGIKLVFNILPYSIVPIPIIAISSFFILIPLTLIFGFMFALGCRMYAFSSEGGNNIGMVYALEAIGAILGGIITSFFLIKLFNPFEIMGILSIINILTAFFFLRNLITLVFSLLFMGIFACSVFKNINDYCILRQFKGYNVISSKNSIYGNITLIERENQYSFFYNGLYLYTIADKLSSESIHFNLLSHPMPLNVLLIGGNLGLIGEILKHPVKNIDYVEIDPLIIKTARDYLPKGCAKLLNDKRVKIKFEDGRFFIKKTHSQYDCVIVSVGMPWTAQLNRYYTVDFFKQVKKVLAPTGIFSFGVLSSENYIGPPLLKFLNSISKSLYEVFSDVKVIPGDLLYFLASPSKGILSYDYKHMTERAEERKINVEFVREYYLSDKLSKERVEKIEESLYKINSKINYDKMPIASYYCNIAFLAEKSNNDLFKKVILWQTPKRVFLISLCFFLFIFLFSFLKKRYAILLAIMTTGFSEIAFQTIVLLSFQLIYGYMFYKLGLIITSFMIGLSCGSFWIVKHIPKNPPFAFMLSQIGMCIYPLLPSCLFFFNSVLPFLCLPIIPGFIGGIRFTLANKIYLKGTDDLGKVGGLNYAMILLGSCLGAFLLPPFILFFGIDKTCIGIALLNILVLMALLLTLH